MSWSAWGLDLARSDQDTESWHVYRAANIDGNWVYDQRQYLRQIYPDSAVLVGLLNTPQAANGYGGPDQTDPLADAVQDLQIGSNNPFRSSTSNPFHSNGAGAANPFLRSASARPSRRENPGYGSGSYTTHGGGGYLVPGQNPLQSIQRSGRRSATPAVTTGRPSTTQPRQKDRERGTRSAMGFGSSRSSEQAPSLKGYRTLKPKELRAFFKSGRVFKAFFTKTDETNNPFGEILPFVVVRPSKYHSVCLAVHTYGGKATTASHARPRDHVVIYSGDHPPALVEGESESIWNRRPIQVILDPKAEHLLPASRLNVAKPVTIDHDTPVAKLGKISSKDVERLRQYSGVSTSTQALDDLEEDEDEDDAYR